MNKFLASISAIFILFTTYHSLAKDKGKDDLVWADHHYDHFAYNKAIPYYEKVADKLKDPVVYGRLGDCYRFTNDFPKAAEAYVKATRLPGCEDKTFLSYGHVLMDLMRYKEAEKQLKKYQDIHENDTRVANMIAACELGPKMSKAKPTGKATLASFNTDGAEFAPALWNGKLVFTSDAVKGLKKKIDLWTGKHFYNIYAVSCDANGVTGNDLKEIAKSSDINISYHNGPATFGADGKEMYYTRSRYRKTLFSQGPVANRDGVVLQEIMIATEYDSHKREFKKIAPFQYNSSEYSVGHPTVSPDGKTMVFSSDMPGGTGGSDLYMCQKTTDGDWSKPENVGAVINTEGEEMFPYFADNKTLYFSSDGHEGLGGLDIYKCRWDETSHIFSKPENVGTPINSSYDDISLALSPNGKNSWFSSNRPATKKGDNIYFYQAGKINQPPVDSPTQVNCCTFRVDSLRITCNGKDSAGNPTYHITFVYHNDPTASGIGYLGHHSSDGAGNPAPPDATGNYLNVFPAGTGGTLQNITPGTGTVIMPGQSVIVSFDLTPSPGFTAMSIFGTDITGTVAQDCTDPLKITFPSCNCTFCDVISDDFGPGLASIDSGNNMNITTTIGSPGVSMKSLKAEIIGFQQTSTTGNEACFPCNKNSATYGNFTSGTLTTSGSGAQNGKFTSIPGSGFTHHTLSWSSSAATTVNGADIDLNISVPPFSTISCCDDIIQVCIRYSFTDEDCRTCSFIKCYTVNRTH